MFLKLLFELLHLRPNDRPAIALVGIGPVKILMIILRLIELRKWHYFSCNCAGKPFLRLSLGFFRRGFLRRRAIKDNGTILCSGIVALAIQSRRVVSFPKSFENL